MRQKAVLFDREEKETTTPNATTAERIQVRSKSEERLREEISIADTTGKNHRDAYYTKKKRCSQKQW